ncbi:NAD(P)-dependent oxidoreductase [Candidatus Pacearchaeota archaeon]|nr:NAD(P)-dependent oxidoreductase [Candidatus Pacearchaeota archaeon]
MTDTSKALIIGGESAIAQELPFGIKVSHKELDVMNISQIEQVLSKYKPSTVICLASIDLPTSQKNPSLAYAINVVGLCNVATQATKMQIPIVMISTGAIFNGPITKVFSEQDTPHPLNVYGQTKYLAELLLRQMTPNHLIIRTGWLFGLNHKKNGFTRFIDNLLNTIDNGNVIKVTQDQIGSPTYIRDFSIKLKELIESNAQGTIHVVNKGIASAFDIAQEALKITSKKTPIEVVSTKDISGAAARSKSEALESKITLRSWQEALNSYYSEIINDSS